MTDDLGKRMKNVRIYKIKDDYIRYFNNQKSNRQD
jgi:hypothetical protein